MQCNKMLHKFLSETSWRVSLRSLRMNSNKARFKEEVLIRRVTCLINRPSNETTSIPNSNHEQLWASKRSSTNRAWLQSEINMKTVSKQSTPLWRLARNIINHLTKHLTQSTSADQRLNRSLRKRGHPRVLKSNHIRDMVKLIWCWELHPEVNWRARLASSLVKSQWRKTSCGRSSQLTLLCLNSRFKRSISTT